MTDNRRWWALGALVLSMLTIGTGGLRWIVNSYTLVFAGLLLPFGAVSDRHGRKKLIVIGLAVFGSASLVAVWWGSIFLINVPVAIIG